MSIHIPKLFILLSVLFTTVQACKTDKPEPGPDPYTGPVVVSDVNTALTNNSAKKWKPVKRTLNGTNQPLQSCEKDDRWIFNKNGQLYENHGTENCFVNEPAADTLSWNFSASNTYIIINGLTYKIYELTGTSFATQHTHIVSGQTQTVISSFTAAP